MFGQSLDRILIFDSISSKEARKKPDDNDLKDFCAMTREQLIKEKSEKNIDLSKLNLEVRKKLLNYDKFDKPLEGSDIYYFFIYFFIFSFFHFFIFIFSFFHFFIFYFLFFIFLFFYFLFFIFYFFIFLFFIFIFYFLFLLENLKTIIIESKVWIIDVGKITKYIRSF